MAKIQIKNSFITSSADITISSSMVKFSSGISAKNITGSFSGSIPALTSYYKQGGNSFGTTAILGTNDNQSLTFETNASEKVRITSDGIVGIGTSSPNSWTKLEVNGTTAVNGILYINENYKIQALTAFPGSAGKLILNGDGGSVGIGTTSPSSKLHISNTSAATRITITDDVSNGRSGYIESNYSDALVIGTTSGVRSIRFAPDNSTAMTIAVGTNNVGIGTTNPTQRLDLSGSLRIRSSGTYSDPTDNAGFINYDSQGGIFTISARSNGGSTYMAFRTSNSGTGGERMRIINDGNVGIGTSTPSYLLDVYSGNQDVARFYNNQTTFGFILGSTANTSFTNLLWSTSTGNAQFFKNRSSTSWGGADSFNFYTSNGGFAWHPAGVANAMYLTTSGNLGIGSTSPTSAASFNKVVEAYDATSLSYQVNSGGTYKAEFGISSAGGWLGTSTTHDMRLVSNGTERMRIASGGNVGIGTTSPATRLDVNGTIALSGVTFALYSGNYTRICEPAGGASIYLGNATDPGNYYDNTTHYFRSRGGGTNYVIINSSGNVGIGTTSPNAKLQVVGNVRATSFTGSFSGSVVGSNMFVQGGNSFGTTAILGTSDNQALILETNNSEKLRITTAGNVGIGTTIVAATFHVVGQSFLNNVVANTAKNQLTINVNGSNYAQFYDIGVSATNALAIGGSTGITAVPSAPIMTWALSSGNVGIGTSSPAYKLDVIGPATSNGVTLRLSDAASLANSRHILLTRGSVSGSIGIAGSQTEDPLWLSRSSGYDLMVASSGNIGIGTSTPSQLVEAYKSSNGDIVYQVTNPNTGANATAQFFASNGTTKSQFFHTGTSYSGTGVTNYTGLGGIYNASTGISLSAAGASGFILFGTGTSQTERMRIASDGNVGIGTSSPAFALDVTGGVGLNTSGTGVSVTIGANNTSDRYLRIRNSNGNFEIGSAGNQHYLYGIGASNYFSIYTNVTERMRITADGVVLIGTTSAYNSSRLLQVKDGLLIGNSLYTFASIDTNSSADLILSSNANPANLGANSNIIFKLGTSGGGGPTERMRIVSDGNVGIGTSTASGLLSLHGTYPQIIANNPTTGSGVVIQLRDNGRDAGFMGHSTTTARLQFGSKGSSAAHMTISETGDVGIGTTAPTAQSNYRFLQVNGTNSAIIETMVGGTRIGGFDSSATALYVGSIGSYPIVFRTAVNEKMRLDTNGNLGIGTSSPATLLHVDTAGADARIRVSAGTNTVQGGMIANSGTSLVYAGSITNHGFSLRTNDTDRVRIDTSGNVGIGTTSPSTKLVASGDATDSDVGQFRVVGSTSAAKMINVGYHTTNNYGFIQALIAGTGYSPLSIQPNGGNVGIGTTSPSSKLHITGSGQTIMRLDSSTTTNVSQFQIKANTDGVLIMGQVGGSGAGNNFGVSAAGQSYIGTTTLGTVHPTSLVIGNASTIPIIFSTNNTERMRILSDGNVGIGTSSPATILQVVGTGLGSVGTINIKGSQAHLGFTTSGGTFKGWTGYFNSVVHGSDLDLNIKTGYAGASNIRMGTIGDTTQVFISGSGNVGIGTTTPAAKLEVASGEVRIGSSVAYYTHLNYLNTGTNYISCANNQSTIFRDSGTAGTMMVIVGGTGNVGIGTTSPASLLQVGGSSGATATPTAITFDNTYRNGVGGNTSLKIYLYKSGGETYGFGLNNAAGIEYHAGSSGGSTANHAFYTETTEKMRIISDGNVGIGTSSPTAKLHLTTVGGDGTPALRILASASDTFNWASSTMYANLAAAETAIHLIGKAQSQYNSAYLGYRHVSDTSASNMLSLGLYAADHLVNILGSGNVGIGTTSPAYKLDVNGAIGVGGLRFLDLSTNYFRIFEPAGNIAIYLGNAADPSNYFDNTNHVFRNRGGSSVYALINSNGNLGIGTTSPTTKLAVSDGTTIAQVNPSSNVAYFGTVNNYPMALSVNSSEKVRVDTNGNVGVGTSSPVFKLDVNGTSGFRDTMAFGPSIGLISWGSMGGGTGFGIRGESGRALSLGSNGSWDYLVINTSGNVGIGTTSPISKLNTYASGSNLSVFKVDGGNGTLFEVTDQLSGSLFSVNDVSGLPLLEVFSNNRVVAGKYGSNALVISGSSVGIGTTTPAYKLQVNGSFGATTKSFVIDHPTKEGKKLVYGSLESPYHGIRLTGRNMLIDGECKVQLPDYIYKLARPESVNIQITPIKCGKVIYVDEISVENNYFVVKYDKSLLESYKNYEFFWDFTATRSDVEQLVVEQ